MPTCTAWCCNLLIFNLHQRQDSVCFIMKFTNRCKIFAVLSSSGQNSCQPVYCLAHIFTNNCLLLPDSSASVGLLHCLPMIQRCIICQCCQSSPLIQSMNQLLPLPQSRLPRTCGTTSCVTGSAVISRPKRLSLREPIKWNYGAKWTTFLAMLACLWAFPSGRELQQVLHRQICQDSLTVYTRV